MSKEYHPLQIVSERPLTKDAISVIIEIMHANARLVKAGKDSALPHFIACVKALEEHYGFKFTKYEDSIHRP